MTVAERAAPTFAQLFDAIAANVERVIRGKPEAIELAVVCLVAEGHLLIEDVPGVGKTRLAKALAASIDCTWKRVQCTPDLLPSDVTGTTVWHRGKDAFEFHPGPVFSNIVLADEINRAAPRTQAALLEAMEERQVTVDGSPRPLPRPFLVLATQNPVEHEGTFGLPDSQLDRFLLRISLGYPARHAELEVLEAHGTSTEVEVSPVVSRADVVAMTQAADNVHVAEALRGYLVDLAEASRRHPMLLLGMSPRATLSLLRCARVQAASAGRNYVVPDDIKSLAPAVLAHRLILTDEAAIRGVTKDEVVAELVATVPVPVAAPPMAAR
jgi:MoxR-like ATPase